MSRRTLVIEISQPVEGGNLHATVSGHMPPPGSDFARFAGALAAAIERAAADFRRRARPVILAEAPRRLQ